MTDRDIDALCMQYLDAIAADDLDALAALWSLADQHPELVRAFRGLHDALRDQSEQ